MEGCINYPYFSVLINGASKCFLKSSRRLRQGDPLSPFLFSIVADRLSVILKKDKHVNLIERFRVGDDKVMVSHLQYVDDSILFLKAEENNIRNIRLCLQIFEVISGLKINFTKSCIMRVYTEDLQLEALANIVGC